MGLGTGTIAECDDANGERDEIIKMDGGGGVGVMKITVVEGEPHLSKADVGRTAGIDRSIINGAEHTGSGVNGVVNTCAEGIMVAQNSQEGGVVP